MRFDDGFEANDANYGQYRIASHVYGAGPMLPAGTKVVVTAVGASAVAFRPESSEQDYALIFYYGRRQQAASDYFHKILREASPLESIDEASEPVIAAINDGKLVEGMTKEQALIARGYPPAHRTPNLDADEWIYYDTPGFVDRVQFVDEKIASVVRGPAPD